MSEAGNPRLEAHLRRRYVAERMLHNLVFIAKDVKIQVEFNPAQVTAYRQRDGGGGRGPLNLQIDAEDFDFLALSAATNRRSSLTDSKGAFAIAALEPGRYRFCADAAAENHYPAARAFAQRGGPVDCVRVLAMDFNDLRRTNNG